MSSGRSANAVCVSFLLMRISFALLLDDKEKNLAELRQRNLRLENIF